LGLVAFGSLIGNLAQHSKNQSLERARQWWADHATALQRAYDGLMAQYANLERRYEQVKRLNEQLFGEVTCLRDQCDGLARERSALLKECASVTQERDDLKTKLEAERDAAAKRKGEERPSA
jgi:chromosome segregation ATPase